MPPTQKPMGTRSVRPYQAKKNLNLYIILQTLGIPGQRENNIHFKIFLTDFLVQLR